MKEKVTLTDLFLVCMKIGIVTFGGGYSMLPYFYSEILTRRKWFEEEEFVDILTLAQAIPGSISVNASFYIGMAKHGYLGGLVAALGMVLPAFIAVVLIMLFFMDVRDNIIVRKIISGIITASAALICLSAVRLSATVFSNGNIFGILLAVFVFIAVGFFGVGVVKLLLLGVVIGIMGHIWRTKKRSISSKTKE